MTTIEARAETPLGCKARYRQDGLYYEMMVDCQRLPARPNEWRVPATVDRIIDADSFRVTLDLGWHIYYAAALRLAGVDAPELRTDAGKQAKAYVETLIEVGDRVTVISHKLDKYGRVLGTVLLSDGRNLSDLLIQNDHGRPYDGGAR